MKSNLEKIEMIVTKHGENSAVGKLAKAVGVLICTPSTTRHLMATDPEALKQAEAALDSVLGYL